MNNNQILDKIEVEVNYIRHGEAFSFNKSTTVENSPTQKTYDNLALTNRGKLQAKGVAKELLNRINQDEIIILISSPIKRAQQTAKIIKNEFTKHSVTIEEEIVIDFLRSAEGLERLKNEYNELTGNEIFDKWSKLTYLEPTSYLETYLNVANRYKRFLLYINCLRTKYYHKIKKLRVIAIAHAELPDYIMVKYFNKYGLENCEVLNIIINSANNVLLSITGKQGGLKIKETLKNLLVI